MLRSTENTTIKLSLDKVRATVFLLHSISTKYDTTIFQAGVIGEDYSGPVSFTIDWSDFLAVQGALKSLLQHHSSKVSMLQRGFLYCPALTSIHDCWKNHSFD